MYHFRLCAFYLLSVTQIDCIGNISVESVNEEVIASAS